jgi:hypothetical protein
MSEKNIGWSDVERLISDLKSDGYEPTNIETSTSHAAPTKTLFIDVSKVGENNE